MKIIYLNGITTVPNASGEEKIAKANGKKTGEEGYSKEFFREMGLNPPKDLEDDPEYDDFGNILLEESDIDTVFVDVSIPLHLFGGSEDLTDGTTLVYTTYNYVFTVEETTEEITSYVEYLSMSWWEKTRLDFKIWFENIFSRKKKIN